MDSKKKKSSKNVKIIKDTFSEILKLLKIDGSFTVAEDEEEIEINLETSDSGIVIGFHGETLEALQLIVSLSVSKKLGEFKRISVEIGDYKKNRSEWLTNLAYQTKERVLFEGKEIHLPDLKAWERRIVHLLLQNDKEVSSESIGEGKDRVLVIKPKN